MAGRSIVTLLASLVALGTMSSWAMADEPATQPEPGKAANPAAKVVIGNTAFACDLYQKLSTDKGNLFLSPYSISTALAMTYAGARGDTATQMAATLHFDQPAEKLHGAFKSMADGLTGEAGKKAYELSVANALWGQKGMTLQKEFVDLTAANYGAGLRDVDFVGATEAARTTINTWVEQQTHDKIKELIKPGILDNMTRLVLTNAIYFKGQWEKAFDKKATSDAPFTLAVPADQKTPAPKVNVPLMYQKGKFNLYQTDGLQVLELLYKGGDLSMVLILPTEPQNRNATPMQLWRLEAYADLEKSITPAQLDAWLKAARLQEVQVYLPRFTVTKEFSLADTLKSLGMTDAFSGKADFSGMTGTKDLFISAVIHKAFVDVNEEGTEAAAATAVAVAAKNGHSTPTPTFRADHPFLFLIRDVRSGSVLFMGRLMDPKP